MERLPLEEKKDAFLKSVSASLLDAIRKAENKMALHDSITNFALGLERKYPDARSRRLWHLLVGSTPPPWSNMNMEDYPGEDSIVQFIEKLNSPKI